MSQNHNQQPIPRNPELSTDERAVFAIDVAEEWRVGERGRMANLALQSEWGDDSWWNTFETTVDDSLDEFLVQRGLDPESVNYAAIKSAFRDVSIDKVAEWQLPGDDDEGTPKQKFGAIIKSFESSSEDPDDNPDNDEVRRLEHERLAGELGELRGKWAEVSAKRLGLLRAVPLRKKKRQQRKALKAQYDAKVQELGAFELEELLTDDEKTPLEKNAAVIGYVLAEQDKLREATKQTFESSKVSRVVERFNRGGKFARLGKSALVGLGIGAAGALIAGTGGIAGIVAGAGIVGAKIVKGYASSDRHRGTKMETAVNDERRQALLQAAGTSEVLSFDDAQSHTDQLFEADVKKEQNERCKALGIGMAGVATGSIAGYFLATGVAGRIHEGGFNLYDHYISEHMPWNHDQAAAIANTNPPDNPGSGGGSGGGAHEGGSGGGNSDTTTLTWESFVPDAQQIHYGEGGFQTLHEMGIPDDKLEAVWERAGSDLFSAGDADVYRMADGSWGWGSVGTLSENDLHIIVDAAKENGVLLTAEG